MMFLLQTDTEMNIEYLIVKDLINREKYIHSYQNITLEELQKSEEEYAKVIPIGTIEFVTTWLQQYHSVPMEYAIEVPKILRTKEFLKRDYHIVPWKDIPNSGEYFIKDATQLKRFCYQGEMSFLPAQEMDKSHLYQVSEIVNIFSEYRVYILDKKIECIAHYNGDPLAIPDISLINKANILYQLENDVPKSYTMDIMITEQGTSITEIHNFTSIGLYNTVWGTNMLYAYRDGIDYLLNCNKQTIIS